MRILGAVVAAGCAAGALTLPAGVGTARATSRRDLAVAASGPLSVRVTFGGRGRRIPGGFFGLSVEYNELRDYEQAGAVFDRVISMLRPRDGGAMTLRVGGKSADHFLWEPDPETAPDPKTLGPGVFEIGEQWLASFAHLVRQQHLHVLLDLNLAVHSPDMAASFAAAVRKALPPYTLIGLEIGNEPDEYHFQPRLTRDRVATTTSSTPLHWWSNYSYADYRRDYMAYARALHASVPGIRLGAPDITRPAGPWLTDLTGLGSLDPAFFAIHRYATSGCFVKGSSDYPTISNLLDNVNSEGLAASVAPWVGYAHARGMGLRLTEVNSVSCGKDRGVADSFATALWAPDALFSMLRTGVNAVSWHIRPGPVNAPFHLTATGIRPMPELYGLAVFARMTHGPANLLSSTVTGPRAVHLEAWSVRKGPTVNVLLINKGGVAARVSLRATQRGRDAYVRRLLAPRVRSTSGVTFAGMRIGSNGRWRGHQVVHRVRKQGGYYHLVVPAYSAALATL